MDSSKFPLDFFKQFDFVLLALDNGEARSYLNRVCGPLGIPLFEAGTSGFAGQTYPIFWGETRCYDCLPKPKRKTFPVCTIRTIPSKPIHCMVWAKQVFKDLFTCNLNRSKGKSNGSFILVIIISYYLFIYFFLS